MTAGVVTVACGDPKLRRGGIRAADQPVPPPHPNKDFRFRQASRSPAMWLSHRFNRDVRDVAALRAARRVIVTKETVRQGCRTCGQQGRHTAAPSPCTARRPSHGDDVLGKINGKQHHLWRVMDQHGNVFGYPCPESSHKGAAAGSSASRVPTGRRVVCMCRTSASPTNWRTTALRNERCSQAWNSVSAGL